MSSTEITHAPDKMTRKPLSATPSQAEVMAGWKGDLSSPHVTVICHTFQHVAYVRDTLDGFLMQRTTFPFEILVHDDASSDGTVAILQDYRDRYPDIIRLVLQTENQYQLGRRPASVTFPAARGKYLATCEGDDYWTDPEKLQRQADYLDAHPETAVVFHDVLRVVGDSEEGTLLSPDVRRSYSAEELQRSPFVPTLTRMMRNVDIEWLRVPGFPVAADICISSYLGRCGGAHFMADVGPAVYRVHEAGIWSMRGEVDKVAISVAGFLFIAARYEAEGRDDLKDYFMQRATEVLMAPQSTRGLLSVLRNLLARLRVRFFQGIKRRLGGSRAG